MQFLNKNTTNKKPTEENEINDHKIDMQCFHVLLSYLIYIVLDPLQKSYKG